MRSLALTVFVIAATQLATAPPRAEARPGRVWSALLKGGRKLANKLRKTRGPALPGGQRLESLPALMRAPTLRLIKKRPNEARANEARIQGLAFLGASIEKGVDGHPLPRPLRKLIAGLVERRVLEGYELQGSDGEVVHRNSGSIHFEKKRDHLDTRSLFVWTRETSTWTGPRINVSDISGHLELSLMPKSTPRDGTRAADAAWLLRIEQRPESMAWLAGLGEKGAEAVAKALENERPSTYIVKATPVLEFDAKGTFLGANTETRHWDVAGR